MSGIDEVVYDDIPICSECGERPAFWILSPSKGKGWFWLFSDDYIREEERERKLERTYNKSLSLDDITYVRCRVKGITPTMELHDFTPETAMFKDVICYARMFENDERN